MNMMGFERRTGFGFHNRDERNICVPNVLQNTVRKSRMLKGSFSCYSSFP